MIITTDQPESRNNPIPMPFIRSGRRRLIAWTGLLAFCVVGFVWTANLYRRSHADIRAFHTGDVSVIGSQGELDTAPQYVVLTVSQGSFVLYRYREEQLVDENHRFVQWILSVDTLARAPIWLILISWLALLTLVGWRVRLVLRSRASRQTGRCMQCGYDLRATPERCPECGTARVAESVGNGQ